MILRVSLKTTLTQGTSSVKRIRKCQLSHARNIN